MKPRQRTKALKILKSILTQEEGRLLEKAWRFWARDDQLPREDSDWTTWLYLGGRGAGKTRAGAEWLRGEIEAGRAEHIALVGETFRDVRAVMVEGPTGLLSLESWRARPRYFPSQQKIVFASGAVAKIFSAEDPDSLRGHQFTHAWSDEICKWPKPEACWDMLQLGLRLGKRPRQAVTTTPRPIGLLKKLIADPMTQVTRAGTYANRANLAPAFLTHIVSQFENTRLGRQELQGEILDDNPGALFQGALIEKGRVKEAPALRRIVVAVDPPVTSGPGASACGIVVAGEGHDGHGYVLADRTMTNASPLAWAGAVVMAYQVHEADRVIAEVNQGGDLVETVLRQVDGSLPVTKVHASRGKSVRAEPVAALYEQGRVHHVGLLAKLEDALTAFKPGASLADGQDRLDALVWALTHLMLKPPRVPHIRAL